MLDTRSERILLQSRDIYLQYTEHISGVWTNRAGLKQGPGVPYSQIRILARARWQLFHIKKFLDRKGLKGHTVLLGDNSGLEDEDDDLVELPETEDLEDKDEQVSAVCLLIYKFQSNLS